MALNTHFTSYSLLLLFTGLFLTLLSFYYFRKGKFSFSIVLLTLASFTFRYFTASADPFLRIWDEQLHALVAKNLMSHPLVPTLYEHPVLPYNDTNWFGAHIWMHKPPLFLWLMALSMKIFGVNEIALRLPSVVMSATITFFIYRIGKITLNEKVGYYSAFLFTLSSYMLDVPAGVIASDHSDAVFISLVIASFWAFFEYTYSGKLKWLYIIGILCGAAVLTKWLMGLLVYITWLISILSDSEKRKTFASYRNLFLSGIIAALVFVPWQVYILCRFPTQAIDAYKSFSAHVSQSLDGHTGNAFYHVSLLGQQFGTIVPFILLPALFIFYLKLKGNNFARIILFVWLLTTYVVYAIAKTKMPLFVLIASPVIFLSLGTIIELLFDFMEVRIQRLAPFIIYPAFILIGFFNLNIDRLEEKHTNRSGDEADYGDKKALADALRGIKLPGTGYVIFNGPLFFEPEIMFYTGQTAYYGIPATDIITTLEKQGVKIAVFDNTPLPVYIQNDPAIIKIHLDVKDDHYWNN